MAAVAAAAAAVASWGAAAGAAVAAVTTTAIGAVVESVVVGVIYGAAIGAATSAITGENILTGALKGAAIGGISSGVVTGLGQVFSSATSSISQGTGTIQLQNAAAPEVLGSTVETGSGLTTGTMSGELAGTGAKAMGDAAVQASSQTVGSSAVTTGAEASTASKGFWESAKTLLSDKEVVAGGAKGLFEGMGQMGAAMMSSDSKTEAVEREAELAKEAKDNNKVGEFVAHIANISVPNWWEKYVNPAVSGSSTKNSATTTITGSQGQGLLNQGAVTA